MLRTNRSVRVAVRALRGNPHDLHPGSLEYLREARHAHRVPILDEMRGLSQEAVLRVEKVAPNLLHPLACRVHHDPTDLDGAALDVHDEEHEMPYRTATAESLDREEVARVERLPVRLHRGRVAASSFWTLRRRSAISPSCRVTSTPRTARCGPACRVVWEGRREANPHGPLSRCALIPHTPADGSVRERRHRTPRGSVRNTRWNYVRADTRGTPAVAAFDR